MKKLFGLMVLLCAAVIVFAMPAMAAEMIASGDCGSEGNKVKWTLNDEGLMTISGNGEMMNYSADTDVPWHGNRSEITTLEIENGVTQVGSYAFINCGNLTSVRLPQGLIVIGNNAFQQCSGLTSVDIPKGVTSIGVGAFVLCENLSSVRIPSSVITIGTAAFYDCSNLETIYFEGDAPTSVGGQAFSNISANVKIYYYEDSDGWSSPTWTAPDGTVYNTVELTRPTDADYTAELKSDTVSVDKNSSFTVTVCSDNPFSASELTLTYNPAYLTYKTSSAATDNVTVENGIIKLADYGDPKSSYTFEFTATGAGTTEIRLTSAKFSEAADAASKDLTAAVITNDTVSVTVQQAPHQVTLSPYLSGNATVPHNEAYTFVIQDEASAYHTYEISATMGGQTVPVKKNDDGSYTIENVTGALVISAERTAKMYAVSFTTETAGMGITLPANVSVPYGTDYSFTLPNTEGYSTTYTVAYATNENSVEYAVEGNTVTIPGTAIIDAINVTINQERIITSVSVRVEGNAASDASGYSASAELNQDYTLTVRKDSNYSYIVTATVGGNTYTLTETNGTYTLNAEYVTADIVFTVSKTLTLDPKYTEYLTLNDGAQLYLIYCEIPQVDGQVLKYKDAAMFWSASYNAYCTLIAGTTAPNLSAGDFTLVNGTAAEVSYGCDVNKSGTVDANDAQFVYNMYNHVYDGITETVSVEKYLRADTNGDRKIDTSDAVAVVNFILGRTTKNI